MKTFLCAAASIAARLPLTSSFQPPLAARHYAAPRKVRASRLRAAASWADDKATLAVVEALEQQGLAAAAAWDTVATDFLAPEVVAAAESRFMDNAEIGWVKVGGYAAATRARFVFSNPELLESTLLGEDGVSLLDEEQYAVVLRVAAANDKAGNRFGAGGKQLPGLLAGIGAEFSQLGDILLEGSGGLVGAQSDDTGKDSVAFVVCAPQLRSAIERLLPKSLGGVRSSVDAVAFEPGGVRCLEGALVEMEIGRFDKREYK